MTDELSLKKKLLFYALPYLILILILLVVEGGVRLSLPYIPSIQVYVTGTTHGDDHAGNATFEGDPLLGWRLKPNLHDQWWDYTPFSTNSQHVRYPADIKKKEPGALRIVCLGDSVTFGYRVPTTWADNPLAYDKAVLPYPGLLEDKLKALLPGRKVEVIAWATPGYTSHQGLAWIKRDIGWLQPDILIVNYGWNDSDYRARADKDTLPSESWQVGLRWLSAQSQAVVYAARWLRSARNGSSAGVVAQQVNRVSSEDYVKNMMEITRIAQEHHAKPIILAQVYRDAVSNPLQAKTIIENRINLGGAAAQAGIPFIKIEELIETGYPKNTAIFGEIVHPNHLGHRLMADVLYNYLANNSVL
ncbi:MAG: GDSL-type esterase/lipase family protein [Gallionellaceae bacterium]|nr:GDSL-type esterase/lipase family protein [Gallionellaceae bacterium]